MSNTSMTPGSPMATYSRPSALLKNTTSGTPAMGSVASDLAAVGIDLEQHAGVTRAEEPAPLDVDVQPVRAGVGNAHHTADADRIVGRDDDDLRRIGDVDVKGVGERIVDGPARPPGHGDVGHALPARTSTTETVHDPGMAGIPDVRGEEPPAARDRTPARWGGRRPAIFSTRAGSPARKMPTVFSPRFDVKTRSGLGHERAGDRRQSIDRADELPRLDVDDVHRIVGGVGDVDPSGTARGRRRDRSRRPLACAGRSTKPRCCSGMSAPSRQLADQALDVARRSGRARRA